MTTVGIIGLGKMGLPIGQNLIDSGFEVIGFRRSMECPELIDAGGSLAKSPAALSDASDVILSILPTADDVEHVVLGGSGTLSAKSPAPVHLEMSTIPVARKNSVREHAAALHSVLLDCPISGSPGMVRPRRATTFASGDADAIESVEDVLAAISGAWVNAGEFGAGTALKYVSSMLMATHTVAAAEAIVHARALGLDLALVQRTLETSIAGSALLAQRGPVMAERTWLPAPGPIATLHEILEQVDEELQAMGEARPVFEAAKAVFDEALERGWGHLDIASVHDQIAHVDALESVG